jgi:hypothetical protein
LERTSCSTRAACPPAIGVRHRSPARRTGDVRPARRTRTIVGTTDTDFLPAGETRLPAPGDDIRAAATDVHYLLEAAGHTFPAAGLEAADVLSTFAGLRPLLASGESSPSDSSREHAIWVDRDGVLTVAGGKLTTMRRMAEQAVDDVVELLRGRGFDRAVGACVTRRRPLPGAEHSPGQGAAALGRVELAEDVRVRLVSAYGARVAGVLALADAREALGRRLVPELPYLKAEVLFAVRQDHACEWTTSSAGACRSSATTGTRDCRSRPRGRPAGRGAGMVTRQTPAQPRVVPAAVAASRRWREETPSLTPGRPPPSRRATDSETVKTAPPPSGLRTEMRPPCSCTMA